jgi:hypothetical protein
MSDAGEIRTIAGPNGWREFVTLIWFFISLLRSSYFQFVFGVHQELRDRGRKTDTGQRLTREQEIAGDEERIHEQSQHIFQAISSV